MISRMHCSVKQGLAILRQSDQNREFISFVFIIFDYHSRLYNYNNATSCSFVEGIYLSNG